MKQCLYCGAELKQSRNSTGKYCNNKCQKAYEANLKMEDVEAGIATAGWVKKYLLQKYGARCMDENCAWDFDKRPIPVELEHKDGNSSNNTLENCILLCPNCHSMTSTYKNRNYGNGRAKRRERYRAGKSH